MARSRPRVEFRLYFLGLLVLLGLGALVARLWWVQVARGEKYAAKIGSRSEVTVRIPSVRGEIRDRNGIPLVQNRASYDVDFYLPDLVRGYKQRYPDRAVPYVTFRQNVRGMPKDMRKEDVVKIVNEAIIPPLQELNLAEDYNARRLQTHYRNEFEVPFTYLEDVDFKTLATLSEHDIGLPGVKITDRPVRQYLYGSLAAHLLGYVGPPNEIDKEDASRYNFYQADIEGKSQVEFFMDKYLRGKPGVRIMQRNVKGAIDKELRVDPPQAGSNVYLTIDARIQYIAEQALRGVGRGAAVVVDPNNGDILAMASVPSYDPNVFIPSISLDDWEKLQENEANPLVNRAISAFPPGSTFKIVTGLAGLKAGIGNNSYNCSGGVQYGNHFFKCWILSKGGSHGTIGLETALKVSCNAFFYQYGNAATADEIVAVGDMLGLGKPTGIELTNEAGGVLPGPQWLGINHPRERWTSAYTANISIGQGYDLVTPLQSAMVAATVANGGIAYKPRLIDRVLDRDGNPVLNEKGEPVVPRAATIRADLHSFGITREQIEKIRRGMYMVVNEGGGTGRKARHEEIKVAGKTGSAQAKYKGKDDTIAWFTAFAPYSEPKYAITVMVQGGSGGGAVAAPIADRILTQTFAMDQGNYKPELARLEPAEHPHPFQMIRSISFDDAGPQLETVPEEDITAGSQAPSEPQMQGPGGRPNIRPGSDAQGRVRKAQAVRRAEPVEQPRKRGNIFERIFRPRNRR